MTGNLRPSSRNIPAISRDSNQNLHLYSKTTPPDGCLVTRSHSPSLPPKPSSLKASSRLQPRAATLTTSSILTTSSASVSSFIRSSNPSRLSTETIRPSMILRPSTPTTTASRSSSTPTSRITWTNISTSSRSASNGRTVPSLTKPSSLRPRIPTPVVPEVSLDKPPNLRKTVTYGPISASRFRAKAKTDLKAPLTSKNLSPIVQRQPGKRRVTNAPKSTKVSNVSDVKPQRAVKPSETVKEKTGLGRSFSKSSLDMAIKHMDLRKEKANGTKQFPLSIRSGASKVQPIHTENNLSSINKNTESSSNGKGANEGRLLTKLSDKDNYVCESMRYETLLLKEDVKNTNWLHSIDDRSLDHELELLPEPFDPL